MVGAAAMAAAGATMPGAAGGISAIRLTLIDRRMAVNLRGSLAYGEQDTPSCEEQHIKEQCVRKDEFALEPQA
jgi:hypothetical protein